MSFVQLQVISTNSLMQSTLTIEELVVSAKKMGYKALALTDYNVLFGAVEFYELALKHDIKPIIGLTIDVKGVHASNEIFQLVLLAKNFAGYQELIQLSTMYQLAEEGMQALELDDILTRSQDLVVICPSENSEVISLFHNNKEDQALDLIDYFMGKTSHFYMGISLQNIEEQTIHFYKNISAPLIGLGNVQYLASEDALPSRVLQVLNADIRLGEEQASINQFLTSEKGDYSLQSPQRVYEEFKQFGLENAAKETTKLAEQIVFELQLDSHIMPTFPVPDGETSTSYLQKLCEEQLNDRVESVTDEYIQRLNKELHVISTMGFSDYFLIVWDIITYAHQKNIYTGSGRGSAAGSLVAFLLEITNVDPIQYDLLFERFLNEERYTMPDIDLDFPDNRREQILHYIVEKYGSKNVAQIGTIGTYGAKSAIRDVARVLGATQDTIKKWAKALPNGPNVTLENARNEQNVQNLLKEDEQNQRIFNIARKIEGCNRHVSTHAAAVVIADHPLTAQTPLQKGSNNINLTQYTMLAVEKVGLLKLDILGLRNLAILSDCIRFIPYENNGKKIDIDKIPFDDERTLEIFRSGDTDGVFQFESEGIRRVLRRLKPTSFEDVVAVNALYRPGPMEQIDTFIKRKNGLEAIRYPHEDLKSILEITYGIMVYQEQVMQVASKMAGYTLNEADILRRAISKKDHLAIEAGREQFVKGSTQKGYSEQTALEVYGYIEQFADYGFNRSHAVAYSKVAYQLAYVKANYPASFFAAIMQSASKNKAKIFVKEAKNIGIEFLPPQINKSYRSPIIENGKIQFGFDIIKGIPQNFVQEIIQERKTTGEFTDLINFLSRIGEKWLSEDYILPFIHSGAFDEFADTRNSLLHSLSSVLESIKMSHGNVELFEIFAPSITEKEELTDDEKMKQEFEATGFYFTAEPGEKYKELRENPKIKYLADISNETYVEILAVIEKIKTIQTKNGESMSFVDVIDSSGKGNLTLFPNVHRRYIQKIAVDDTILVKGKVEQNQAPIKIIVNEIKKAAEIIKNVSEVEKTIAKDENQVLYIRFESLSSESKKLKALQEVLKQFHGNTPVIIYDMETKEQRAFKENYFVNIQSELIEILEKMFKKDNILLRKPLN